MPNWEVFLQGQSAACFRKVPESVFSFPEVHTEVCFGAVEGCFYGPIFPKIPFLESLTRKVKKVILVLKIKYILNNFNVIYKLFDVLVSTC